MILPWVFSLIASCFVVVLALDNTLDNTHNNMIYPSVLI